MIGPCKCGHGIAMHQHRGKEGTAWCRRKSCSCALYRPTFGMPTAAHPARPEGGEEVGRR